jgi:hypothetical protein
MYILEDYLRELETTGIAEDVPSSPFNGILHAVKLRISALLLS